MSVTDPEVSPLLERAAAARAVGDTDAMKGALFEAFDVAKHAGNSEAMATAALALPLGQRFGAHPGRIPVVLHEAYERSERAETRCRLAAALARSWVYGYDATRAVRFADEALALATDLGTPDLVADALEASLVARWGPDDFTDRVSLAVRLEDAAAHLLDDELRLMAHLWRLTTAWECLDIVAVHRQLKALDVMADETGSPRIAFYAASRAAMHAIAVDDLPRVDQLIARTEELGAESGEPDAEAVVHSLTSSRALRLRDLVALRTEAEAYIEFGSAEGIPSIAAEGAMLLVAAGEPDRAALLAEQLVVGGFDNIARDVDFLLTASCVVSVAADVGLADIARDGLAALEPYAGRAILNGGAVTFRGVVDDYLFRAARALDEPAATGWKHRAETAYRRIGATWWAQSLSRRTIVAAPAQTVHLHPGPDGWIVGIAGATVTMRDTKGLRYLRELLRRPGTDIAAATLSDAVAGHPGESVTSGHLGEVLDREALTAFRRRLAEIETELDEADSRGDPGRAETLHAEREAILAQVREATGLGGRRRRPGSSEERARTAVRKALAATLSRIESADPALGRLLRDTVRTGAACRYEPIPDRPIVWVTEAPPVDADASSEPTHVDKRV